jgi:putative ABC transport system ATP-binding protein
MAKKNSTPILELKNISKYYTMGESVVRALDGVSLKINEGELISIVGSSGSGKSTLLHILGLLDKPTKGEVFVEGKNINSFPEKKMALLRNQTIGFVFQQFNLLSKTSVLDNTLLPFLYNPNMEKREADKRARMILKKVGLSERMDHLSNQLSGGQQQRVAIARALMCDPKFILADEPTGNLDSKTGKEITELLIDLHKESGKTLIFVTHDQALAKFGKKRIYLSDGKIVKEEE